MSAVAVREATLFDGLGQTEAGDGPAVETAQRRPADDGLARGEAAPSARSSHVGGESSLAAVVSGMWEGLAVHETVACPLCQGEMTPVYGAHVHAVGGRCQSCGTTLS